jgi:DNA-binding NarL/FixJ family response regulator
MTLSWSRPPTEARVASSTSPAVRVVVADRFTMFREAVRAALSAEGGFTVVAEAGDGDEAVHCVLKHRPHMLLLDLALPRASGLDALRRLRSSGTTVHTVVLANEVTSAELVAALALGARGVLTKDVRLPVLFDCVRAVAQGNYWIGDEHLRNVVDAVQPVRTEPPPAPARTLTAREREIADAVGDGATNRDISETLKLSVQTVKNHLRNVFHKLGVSSRVELALHLVHRSAELQPPVPGLRQ